MPAALPPVTDCGCSTATISTSDTASCCPYVGVNNPNLDGLIPTDQTLWNTYYQLADLVSGPVAQVWYWNPNLLVWQ